MYLHLFKIAIYLWLGFIRDTTEFQFAFHCKMKFISFSSGEVMQHFCLFESQHAFFSVIKLSVHPAKINNSFTIAKSV